MRRLAAVVVMSIAAASLIAIPPAQADAPRILSGWLPYWMTSPNRPAGVNSAVANADLLSDVSPFWYSAMPSPSGITVRTNPNFTSASTSIPWALGQLRGAGLRIIPAIADSSGKGVMASVLADPAKRGAHIADIVNLVMSNNYDGIDLDYEIFAFSDGRSTWASTQPNWTAFVTELGAALRAKGKVLSVTIPPQCSMSLACGPNDGYWVYNIAGIAPAVDRIRIMAYDYHVQSIGPIAPINWVRGLAANAASIMPASKVSIGVPTYGRSWTLKTSTRYRLSGSCPSEGTSAYRSLTSMVSVPDADIPSTLAAVGVDPATVQWDPASQESWVEYDKNVSWTDGSGASQTCTARRIMWWVGPQAVLARTQLVGDLGLGGASLWTIGGDDPAQWPLVRSYAQSLAAPTQATPAALTLSAAAPNAPFNVPLSFAAKASANGAPLAGAAVTLQFQAGGSEPWTPVATATSGADGSASFAPVVTSGGSWRVVIPGANGQPDQASEPIAVGLLASVKAKPRAQVLGPLKTTIVRVVALPASPGQVIVIQRNTGKRWKPVAQGVVDARGVALVPVRVIKKPGPYTYRAVAKAAGSVVESTSKTFRITVRR